MGRIPANTDQTIHCQTLLHNIQIVIGIEVIVENFLTEVRKMLPRPLRPKVFSMMIDDASHFVLLLSQNEVKNLNKNRLNKKAVTNSKLAA